MLKINSNTGETVETSLLDLIDGGVKELADLNMRRVLENIRDVNTDPKKSTRHYDQVHICTEREPRQRGNARAGGMQARAGKAGRNHTGYWRRRWAGSRRGAPEVHTGTDENGRNEHRCEHSRAQSIRGKILCWKQQ